jgi:hypothetical protein
MATVVLAPVAADGLKQLSRMMIAQTTMLEGKPYVVLPRENMTG